jgi:hypothetical protein
VLLVTRDPHNAPRLKRDRRIVETNSEPRLGVEPTITDVWASLKHVAFQDLMHFYIEAPSAVVLEDSIYGWLTT